MRTHHHRAGRLGWFEKLKAEQGTESMAVTFFITALVVISLLVAYQFWEKLSITAP